jgi:uncharacterized membrane protein YqjE
VNPDPERTEAPSGTPAGVLARVVQLVRTRVELAAFELTEEGRAAVELLILLAAGGALAAFAVLLLTAALILALDPDWRALGAAIVGLAYGGAAAWLFFRVRRILKTRPPPFAATAAELKRDCEWLGTLK